MPRSASRSRRRRCPTRTSARSIAYGPRNMGLDEAEIQRRVKEAEQRAPVRTPRSADKDTQFDE